jgi:HK97 gp10 family phage protein
MKISATVKTNTEGLDNILKFVEGNAWAAVSEIAGEGVQVAKEASRVDTEDMRKGWTRRRVGKKNMPGYIIYNTIRYTPYHEFGTATMPAQPMLEPAIRHMEGRFAEVLRHHIEASAVRAINDAGEEIDPNARKAGRL